MQQQQLAAQLAHHGPGSRPPPPLSPNPHSSDDDSDISLGAHSPPLPGSPLRFGSSSPTPTPLTSFRFGPHSPGPMPTQFRFSSTSGLGSTTGAFSLHRTAPSIDGGSSSRQSSPSAGPGSEFNRSLERKMSVDSSPNVESTGSFSMFKTGENRDETSPINVDSSSDYAGSRSPTQNHQDNNNVSSENAPAMNLRIPDSLRLNLNPHHQLSNHNELLQRLEHPLPLRLTPGNTSPLTTPLSISVANSQNRLLHHFPGTDLGLLQPHLRDSPHSGIVRIAPNQSPPTTNVNSVSSTNTLPVVLHRPFSPARLT